MTVWWNFPNYSNLIIEIIYKFWEKSVKWKHYFNKSHFLRESRIYIKLYETKIYHCFHLSYSLNLMAQKLKNTNVVIFLFFIKCYKMSLITMLYKSFFDMHNFITHCKNNFLYLRVIVCGLLMGTFCFKWKSYSSRNKRKIP